MKSDQTRIPISILVAVAAAIAISSVAHVQRQHAVTKLSYDVSDLRRELSSLEKELRDLERRKAAFLDPKNLRGVGARLGLGAPQPRQFRVMEGSGNGE